MKQLNEFVKALCKSTFVGLLFFVSVCFVACSDDEPNFPDPGIDMTQQQDVVVHRDTASTYVLTMNVSTPGGLKMLQIMNPKDDSLIDDLSEAYLGKKEFVLEYPIALPDMDTTLNFNVRIVDEQLRVINKPVTLTVKAVSKPTITLVGFTENMVIENPNIILKAKFGTGMNTIKEYKLFFGDVLLDSGVPEGEKNEFDYEHLCKLQMDWHVRYPLSIVLIDSKEQTDTATLNLTLKTVSRPVKVTMEYYMAEQEEPHSFQYFDLTYDANDFLKKVDVSKVLADKVIGTEAYFYEYNEQMMVSSMKSVTNDTISVTYLFDYESGSKKLKSSSREKSSGVDLTSTITVTSWDENGLTTSFLRGATAKTNDIHYTMNGDEKVLSEYVWATNSDPAARRHFEEITPVIWPTYCPELPPFFSEFVPKHILNLFCCKYIFKKRIYTYGNPGKPSWPQAGDVAGTYEYALDGNQRVNKVTIIEPHSYRKDIVYYTIYTFEYAD